MIDICAIIERETGQKISEDTPLEELGLDSLEFLQLLLTISNETGKQFSDAQIAEMHRVADMRGESK
jgi:acyl carrier protein